MCGCEDILPCNDNKGQVASTANRPTSPYQIVYWGSNALSSLNNAQVSALQNNQQKLAFAGTYDCNANGYKYICIPTTFGTPTSFINTLNGLNVPMTTSYTLFIGTVNYTVYRTYYPIVGAVSIAIS